MREYDCGKFRLQLKSEVYRVLQSDGYVPCPGTEILQGTGIEVTPAVHSAVKPQTDGTCHAVGLNLKRMLSLAAAEGNIKILNEGVLTLSKLFHVESQSAVGKNQVLKGSLKIQIGVRHMEMMCHELVGKGL